MTCRELIEFLLDYVEDSLPAAQKEPFEAHLDACPECVDYVDSYRKTVDLGRIACAEGDAISSQVPEDLVAAILEARRT